MGVFIVNIKSLLLPFFLLSMVFGSSNQSIQAVELPSLSPVKKTLIGVGSASAFYGYKLIKHFWRLHTIEKELNNSIVSSGSAVTLPFVAWRNAQFNTPEEIVNKKEDIVHNLKSDSRSAVSIGASKDFVRELHREKGILKMWLSEIATMCDAPGHIISFIEERQPAFFNFYRDFLNSLSIEFSDNEKLVQCIEKTQLLSSHLSHRHLNGICDSLKQQDNPHVASSILFRPNWKPWCWVVGPCIKKARMVYFEVFKEYVRLKALQEIIETNFPGISSLKESLRSISPEIQRLITDRPAVDRNNDLKRAWIISLGKIERNVQKLLHKDDVKSDHRALTALNSILETFKTVGSQIFLHMNIYNDPIIRLLNEAKQKVDDLIK
jgi:hypothetical protein